MAFFGIVTIISFLLGLLVGVPVIFEFIKTSFVSKVPSAILAVGFMVIAILSLVCGVILDTIVKNNKMNYELYLTRYKDLNIKK